MANNRTMHNNGYYWCWCTNSSKTPKHVRPLLRRDKTRYVL